MVFRYYGFLTIVLILLIFSAGCTDTSSESQSIPTMSTLPVTGVNPNETSPLQNIGEVTGQGIPGGTIDTITFSISLSDIHTSVDMEDLTIVYADAIRTETLHPEAGFHGDPSKGSWSIVRVENEVGNPNNRLENEEKFIVMINPKAPLVPRQMITVDIKPAHGRSLVIRRIAPPTIQSDNILLPL